jgi:hypothetical protein
MKKGSKPPEERRKELIDVASRLFAEKGYGKYEACIGYDDRLDRPDQQEDVTFVLRKSLKYK